MLGVTAVLLIKAQCRGHQGCATGCHWCRCCRCRRTDNIYPGCFATPRCLAGRPKSTPRTCKGRHIAGGRCRRRIRRKTLPRLHSLYSWSIHLRTIPGRQGNARTWPTSGESLRHRLIPTSGQDVCTSGCCCQHSWRHHAPSLEQSIAFSRSHDHRRCHRCGHFANPCRPLLYRHNRLCMAGSHDACLGSVPERRHHQ